MITLHIPPMELYDHISGKFIALPGGNFRFEHSLKAIYKWEGIYKKPFLAKESLSPKESMDYFCCMCLDNKFSNWYLTDSVVKQLMDYMQASHTATTVPKKSGNGGSRQILSAELIYAYMSLAHVDYKCDKWPIDRLLILLDTIGFLQEPNNKRKRSNAEVIKDYKAINARRKAALAKGK